MKKYNSFLISSILASLILVGCGGGGGGGGEDNSTPDTGKPSKPGNTDQNSTDKPDSNTTKPVDKNETIVKTVTVVDDYVIGATVKDENDNQASYVKDKKHYAFKNFIGLSVSSTGGKVDINGNNIADLNEPEAYKMYASSTKKFINPFTTIAYSTSYTDEQVGSMFGLKDIDINTVTDDIKVRKAVVVANALINEVYKKTKKPNVSVPSGEPLFPLAAKTFQSVVDQFYTLRKTKNDIDAIVEITKNDSYKKLKDNNLKTTNDLLHKKLKEYEKERNTTPSDKPDTGGGNNGGGNSGGGNSGGGNSGGGNSGGGNSGGGNSGGGNSGGGNSGGGNSGGGNSDVGTCSDGTTSIYCKPPNNPNNPNTPISQSKTRDGFTKAEINTASNSALIKAKIENINLVRIDRVAYFIKNTTPAGVAFSEANSINSANYPPNPPAFPSSIELTADGNNTKIEFDINRTSNSAFNFQPTYLDYK